MYIHINVSRRQSSFHCVPSRAFHAFFFLAVCSALTSTRLTTTTPAGRRASQQGSLRRVQSSAVLLEEPGTCFRTNVFLVVQVRSCSNPSKSSIKTFVFFSRRTTSKEASYSCWRRFARRDLVSFSIGVKWDVRNIS